MILLLAGCSDYQLELTSDVAGGGEPRIEVSPTLLDFWEVASDETAELSFRITSVGEAQLALTELVLDEGPFSLVEPPELSLDLEPGDWIDVTVAYSPTSSEEQSAEVLVRSTDPEAPEVPVLLLGEGLAPWLVIDPEEHDFGELPAGCDAEVELTLQNQGEEDLELEALEAEGITLSEGPDLPLALAPGAWTTVTLTWTAVEGDASATLVAVSNDPRGDRSAVQTGSGTGATEVSESFTVPADQPVDVVLAVDQSCSMEDDAERLALGFETFVDELDSLTRGWKLGVVTYDTGCFNETVFTSSSPGLDGRFSAAVQAGEDDEIQDDEALLQLSARALSLDASGACNEGFRRADASLQIIVVSDEPERSTDEVGSWTWEHWLGEFRAEVASDDLLGVNGVVDLDGCGSGADGYEQIIAETSGIARSVCDDDWEAHLSALADAATSALYTFELTGEPVDGTVSVWLGGVELEVGWTLDGATLVVQGAAVAAGDEVEVRYEVAESCP